MTDPSETRRPKRGLRFTVVREALRDLWTDYHWPTKLTLFLLILSCLAAVLFAGWPEWEDSANPVLRIFGSDAVQTLLTLAIALFIAVNFQIRASAGLLDGEEHYNIARGIAFGYFKNFLVPALQLAERQGGQLRLFRPTTMDDLTRYTQVLEPLIRDQFDHRWMPLVETPRPGQARRTVLSIMQPVAADATPGPPTFFDAPTALFTIIDFYAMLSNRREAEGKEPLSPANVRRYQDRQIDSFYRHLDFLFTSAAGFSAVSDIVVSPEALKSLRAFMQQMSIDQIDREFPTTAAG